MVGGSSSSRKLGIQGLSEPEDTVRVTRLFLCRYKRVPAMTRHYKLHRWAHRAFLLSARNERPEEGGCPQSTQGLLQQHQFSHRDNGDGAGCCGKEEFRCNKHLAQCNET